MQMILHGQRIATNGDVRLMPTPEQWDLVAKLNGRQADKEHNRLTARSVLPHLPDGLHAWRWPPSRRRSCERQPRQAAAGETGRPRWLQSGVPALGLHGQNLCRGRQRIFGIFRAARRSRCSRCCPRPTTPKKLPYQEQWDAEKGYTQPLPIVSGNSIRSRRKTRCIRVSITSETGPVFLFDGRNRAQNGWFVLRTLIPSGKTEGAVVWHIHPNVIPNWTRPPMVAHSQVGYAPNFPKIAVIELDPKFDAPRDSEGAAPG